LTSRFLKQSLFTASIVTIAAGILSRPFGYLREAVIADLFGTSSVLETFILAFTVPELIAAVVYAAVPTALIPALQGSDKWPSGRETRLFWRGLGLLGAILGLLSLVIFLLRSQILTWLAPTLDAEATLLGRQLLGIVSLVVLFRGLEAYFRGWLHKYKHFLGLALSPFVLNAVLLGFMLLLHDRLSIGALAYGWLTGTAMLFIYSGFLVWRVVGPGRFDRQQSVSLSPLMRLMLSVAIVEVISFVYPAVDRAIAARCLSEGQIAALRYSFYLVQLPPGVLVVAFSLASFPWITDLSVPSELERLRKLYQRSTGMIIYAILPVVVGMVIFAPEIVQVAFQRGEFDAHSSYLTTGPFIYYSLGLLFYSVYIYQMRYYYAKKLMFRLGMILAVMLAVKVVASLLLVGPLEHEGLALATSLAWLVGLIMMTIDLGRVANLDLARNLTIRMVRVIPAAAVVAGFWLVILRLWPKPTGSLSELVVYLAVQATAGLSLYAGMSFLFGSEEPRRVVEAVRARMKSPGPDE